MPSLEPRIATEFDRAAVGPITVDITTIGRHSGEPQRIEIWIVKVGERIVIGGSPRPRDWLANLRADSALTVHLKDDLVVDVAMSATEVVDPKVRREIWEHDSTRWYRRGSSIDDLIANAPTVELASR